MCKKKHKLNSTRKEGDFIENCSSYEVCVSYSMLELSLAHMDAYECNTFMPRS